MNMWLLATQPHSAGMLRLSSGTAMVAELQCSIWHIH
jgi:hypothetical protein